MPGFHPDIFAARLKQLRLEHGMSRERLAQLLQCTESTIRRWERGTFLPTAYMAGKIAQQLHVSIDWLIGASEERSNQHEDL